MIRISKYTIQDFPTEIIKSIYQILMSLVNSVEFLSDEVIFRPTSINQNWTKKALIKKSSVKINYSWILLTVIWFFDMQQMLTEKRF